MIFKPILVTDSSGNPCKFALSWMSHDITDEKSTSFQVMAWCCQAASHYMLQWWLRTMMPYGITRPQWVKSQITQLWLTLSISMFSWTCKEAAFKARSWNKSIPAYKKLQYSHMSMRNFDPFHASNITFGMKCHQQPWYWQYDRQYKMMILYLWC